MSSKTEQAIELRRQAEEQFQPLEPAASAALHAAEAEAIKTRKGMQS